MVISGFLEFYIIFTKDIVFFGLFHCRVHTGYYYYYYYQRKWL